MKEPLETKRAENDKGRESKPIIYTARSMTVDLATPLVVALDAGPATLALVGGKGVSLARMARQGLPVPPGFLITTDAYRAFVEANALQAPIIALASNAARPREETSTEIRALFDSAAIQRK